MFFLADKVSVPTSELAALTQSIRSMNEKLENLNPSVLPVRTLLQSDISAKVGTLSVIIIY